MKVLLKIIVLFFVLSFSFCLASSGDIEDNLLLEDNQFEENNFDSGSVVGDNIVDEENIGEDELVGDELVEEENFETGTGEILEYEEETGTGDLVEDITGTGTTTQTGSIDFGSGETISNIGFVLPEIIIEVQSGLDYLSGNIWQCKKEDCKINLTAQNNFSLDFLEKDYSCLWSFSGGVFTTAGTEEKCNPGYVDYETGEYEINLKILSKDDENIYKETSIIIQNLIDDQEENAGTGTITQTGSTDSGIGTITSNTGSIIESSGSLDFKILFQQPTYLLDKDLEKESYDCDREDCKVNLKLVDLDLADFSSKYVCFIDFGFDENTSEKCNPGTIIFPTGETEVLFKVFKKDDESIFKEKTIKIINNVLNSSGGSGGSSSSSSSSNLKTKEIEVQSGLEKSGDKYVCKDELCKINLKYNNNSKETCEWKFGGIEFIEKYKTTCNPGFLYYPSGNYKITLKIFDENGNIKNKEINIENIFLQEKEKNNKKPNSIITLQGKIGKNKELNGNKLICYEDDYCSVNFSGEDSYDLDDEKLAYYWDFGNGEFSDKGNPVSIKYSPGKYRVSLKVEDVIGISDESLFFIEVIGEKEDVLVDFEFDENIDGNVLISNVLVNPDGRDDLEWIELENIGTGSLNLKGLIIDDIIGKGSKAYQVKTDLYLNPLEKVRFYKEETRLNLNNSLDEINLIYDDEIIDKLSWDFSVPDNYLISKDLLSFDYVKAKVIKVIDGDTIVLRLKNGEEKIFRFIGVDTPETKHPKKEVEAFGQEASNFTKSFLEGKDIFVKYEKGNLQDKYGRLLAYVYIGCSEITLDNLVGVCEKNEEKVFFNELLVKLGYARAYLKFPFKYSKEFEELEKEARKQKLGLWGVEELKKEFMEENRDDKEFLELNYKGDFYKKYNLAFGILKDKIKSYSFLEEKNLLAGLYLWGIQDKDSKGLTKDIDKSGEKTKTPNFSQSIAKQKKSLKIYGKTIANTKIVLDISGNQVEIMSDEKGNYSYKDSDLVVGDYKVISKVYDSLGNIFEIPRIKDFEIDEEYYLSMQSYKDNISKEISKKTKRPNFSQSIAKQKKSLKIYGKTLANTKIVLDISGKQVEIMSDEKGNYSYKDSDLIVGDYEVVSKVYDSLGNLYEIPRVKSFQIDNEYYLSMQSYKKTISSSTDELASDTIKDFKIINKAEALDEEKDSKEKDKNFSFYLLDLLLGILLIMFGFLLYKRRLD